MPEPQVPDVRAEEPSPPPAPPPVAEAPDAPVAPRPPEGLAEIEAVWPAVLATLRDENMALAAALSEGRPVELDGKELVVAFRQSDSFKRRKAESESQLVGAAVRELSGASLRLRFEERELPEAVEPQTAPDPDDLINRLKSEFDAEEIIPEEEPS